MKIFGAIVLLAVIATAFADCGCLKCSKNLQVVSPPSAPMKIIYRGVSSCNCPTSMPYSVQRPVVPVNAPCKQRSYGYQLQAAVQSPTSQVRRNQPLYSYSYDVQRPVVKSNCAKLLCGLIAAPDRMVVPAVQQQGCIRQEPAIKTQAIIEPWTCDEEEDYQYALPTGYQAIRPVCSCARYLDDSNSVKKIFKRSINLENILKTLKSKQQDDFVTIEDIEEDLNPRNRVLVNPFIKSKKIEEPQRKFDNNKERSVLDIFGNNKASARDYGRVVPSNKPALINVQNIHVHNDRPNKFETGKLTQFGAAQKSAGLKRASQPFRFRSLNKKESSNKRFPISLKKSGQAIAKKGASGQCDSQRPLRLDNADTKNDFKSFRSNFKGLRNKRALVMNGDHFYRITEESVEAGLSEENLIGDEMDVLGNSLVIENEDSFEKVLLESNRKKKTSESSFDLDNIIPQSPLFYFINFPIRVLNHFHELTKHFSPILASVPQVYQKSTNYLTNFGEKFKRHALDFASNLIGNFNGESEIDFNSLIPHSRSKRTASTNNDIESNSWARSKRQLLKMIDETELQDFLREKLSLYKDDKEEVVEKKPSGKKRLKIEKVDPKIIVDKNGRTFLDIDGIKSPILDINKKIMKVSKDKVDKAIVKKETVNGGNKEVEDHNIQSSIAEIIEQAKSIVGQPNLEIEHYDLERSRGNVKEKINEILSNIQILVHADFAKDAQIFAPIIELQAKIKSVVDNWKKSLINLKHNEISEKIKILNTIQDIQKLKDAIVKNTIDILNSGRQYYSNTFIKILIRLQKLQCILISVVEEFGERIKLGTKFDVANEINYIEHLNKISFTKHGKVEDFESDLKTERDTKLESEMKVLESLRTLLDENKEDRIEEEARLLWEMKNIAKLQFNSLAEVKDSLEKGRTIRRELKIVFDLEKQLEKCERKQRKIFSGYKTIEKEEEIDESKEKVEMMKKPKFKKLSLRFNLPKLFTTKKPTKKDPKLKKKF